MTKNQVIQKELRVCWRLRCLGCVATELSGTLEDDDRAEQHTVPCITSKYMEWQRAERLRLASRARGSGFIAG